MSAPAPDRRIRPASGEDVPSLAALAARAMRETYGDGHPSEQLEAHIAANLTPERIAAEIGDPAALTLIAGAPGTPVGYALLRAGVAPACVTGADPVELARIYVGREALGTGIGSALLRACLEEAARRGHATMWLGVWDRNDRACAFYAKHGFRPVGTYPFTFGETTYEDVVMTRTVAAPAAARPGSGAPSAAGPVDDR